MKMKLELVPLPVSDVDAAVDFYVNKIGFALDHDIEAGEGIRFVQLTPQDSACSIVLGTGITEMKPGAQKNLQMVVDNAQAAYDELSAKGVDMSEVTDMGWGVFTYFADPDGNTWALQQMPAE